MSDNCHNAGRICWQVLADSLKFTTHSNGVKTWQRWTCDEAKFMHFCKTFISVVADFAATYNNYNQDHDCSTWFFSNTSWSSGAQISYFDSFVANYVNLNLILMNQPRFHNTNLFRQKWIRMICRGLADYRHKGTIAEQFNQLCQVMFVRPSNKQPNQPNRPNQPKRIRLNLETARLAKQYLSNAFECIVYMYIDHPKWFTPDRVASILEWSMSIRNL